VVLSLAALAASVHAAPPASADGYRVTTELLAELPDDEMSPTVSWDGLHAAFVEFGEGRRQRFVLDGVRGPAYDEIVGHAIEFSFAGEGVAYRARTGDQWVAVVNGQPGDLYDEVRELRFDYQTSVPYYSARQGAQWRLVVGGAPGPPCDWVEDAYPAFSSDGEHHAYCARRGQDESVVWDGRPGRPYEKVEHVTASPRANHIAYAAKREGQWFAVHDTTESAGHEWVQWPLLSPDGERLTYRARDRGDWFLVLDGQATTDYEEFGLTWFGDDGAHLSFWGRRGDRWFLVRNGEPGPPCERLDPGLAAMLLKGENGIGVAVGGEVRWYDEVSELQSFSQSLDSRDHVCYLARRDGQTHVVLDGLETPWVEAPDVPEARLGHVAASGGGETIAYIVAGKGAACVVVKGGRQPTYDAVGNLQLSPDGSRCAYAALRDRECVIVVDGRETPFGKGTAFGTIGRDSGFAFSPDSRHLAYEATRGRFPNTEAFVVLDSLPGPRFDSILGRRLAFRPDGVLEYLAQRGRQVFRVRHIPQP